MNDPDEFEYRLEELMDEAQEMDFDAEHRDADRHDRFPDFQPPLLDGDPWIK